MKREFLPILLTLASMASCSQEEVAMSGSANLASDETIISFTPNTTRVAVFDVTDMQSSEDGFAVYTTSTTTTDGDTWYLDGSNSYVYSSDASSWGWSGISEEWPSSDEEYPLTFLAIFSTDLTGVSISDATTGAAVTDTDDPLTADITIQDVDSQTDILATTSTVNTKPSDGKLALTFSHILSKIDFGVIAGNAKRVFLASLALNNLDDVGLYSIMNKSWSGNDNSTSDETFSAAYDISDALSSFSNGIVGSDSSETTVTAITNTSDEYSLMLLPQTTSATVVDDWTDAGEGYGASPDGVYIEMLYRTEYYTSDDDYADYIGYENAESHPSYNSTDYEDYAGEALFVKVGYPLSALWSLSNNYTYNIKLATADATNGYLLDDVYYNSEGEPTPFDILNDIEIGDPVSGGYINFEITVDEWGEGDTTTVN